MSFRETYPLIKLHGIGTFLVLFISFAVFPGVCFTKDARLGFCSWGWSVLIYTSIFNTFDTIGRQISGYIPLISDETMLLFSYLRQIFLITFLLLASGIMPYPFNTDPVKIINVLLFGLTNGICFTFHMVSVSKNIPTNKRLFASYLMSAHLSFGIFFGSLIATFAISYLLHV